MNPRIVFQGVLLLSVLLLLISAPATAQHPGGADVFISAEAAHAMAARPSTVVLHVGTAEDAFLAGHIERAQFVPLSALVIERDGVPMELPPIAVLDSLFSSIGITDHAHVLIYGDGAMGDMETLAAARAYFTLNVLGHPHLHMIDGGLKAWRDAGLPLATLSSMPAQAATVEFGAYDLRDALIVATAPQIEARLGDAALLLADARPHPQYTGDEAGPLIFCLTADAAPEVFDIDANYPNPFTTSTEIRFALPEAASVSLVVVDLLGREVARLVDGQRSAGYHRARIDGSGWAGGVYLYRIDATGANGERFTRTGRMTLMR